MVSYGVDRDRIKLDLKAEEMEMVIDTAIPCGLIINELVSNSLKHAFPGDRTGTIGISLQQLRSGEIKFSVCDDGIGIPGDLDIRRTNSMGMHLVTVMVDQLGGTIELKGKRGTRFTIRFGEYHEAGTVLY
jgi:two-component sensor histidine kinase